MNRGFICLVVAAAALVFAAVWHASAPVPIKVAAVPGYDPACGVGGFACAPIKAASQPATAPAPATAAPARSAAAPSSAAPSAVAPAGTGIVIPDSALRRPGTDGGPRIYR